VRRIDAFAPSGNLAHCGLAAGPGSLDDANPFPELPVRPHARLLLALLLAILPLSARAQAPSGSFSPGQRQEIIALIRQALREDPSILRDALTAMETAERRDREGQARTAIARHRDALLRDPADPVRGNPEGTVTVVEFFDARCPYCKRMPPTLAELLRRQRDVRLVSKDMPILGPNSLLASRALLAAQRQGKYGEYQEALLALREEPTEPVLRREAEKLGLNWATLRRDMDDAAIQRRLDANLALAREIGVEGTPAFIIGGHLVPGAVDLATLEQLVAEARPAR
jgi:protein-disulfide isomerase